MRSLCLLFAVLATEPASGDPMLDEFSYAFSRGVDEHPVLRLSGPGASRAARPDGRGLHVILASDRKEKAGHISVTPAFVIRGDCEATLGFELISTGGPLPQNGAGIHFVVKTDGDSPARVSVTRLRKPGNGGQLAVDTYGANLITKGTDGNDKYDTKVISALSTIGRLRIERRGSIATLSAADGLTAPFRVIREIQVGSGQLESLSARCVATSGSAEVRLIDLKVRAEALVNESTTSRPTSRRPTWIWWSSGLAGVAATAVLVFWYRRRQKTAVDMAGARSGVAPKGA